MYKISNFSKTLIMENHKAIKQFIRSFKGGCGDEEDFFSLINIIECNKLGIPANVQIKFDNFINEELSPMVYEHDVVFSKSRSVGTIIDNIQHLETNADALKVIASFYEVLIEKEQKWDSLAEKELKPYLC